MFGLTGNAYSKDKLIAVDTLRASVTMIGSDIDLFYKNTSHQGSMLATSSRLHNVVIRIGKQVYGLLVMPLIIGSTRRGFYADGNRG